MPIIIDALGIVSTRLLGFVNFIDISNIIASAQVTSINGVLRSVLSFSIIDLSKKYLVS